jgi:hypothetical protein
MFNFHSLLSLKMDSFLDEIIYRSSIQTTSFDGIWREAETRLRSPGARLSFNGLLSFEENL